MCQFGILRPRHNYFSMYNIYKKNILSILGVKKMWKGTLFKRRTPGNVIASVVQRAPKEFSYY